MSQAPNLYVMWRGSFLEVSEKWLNSKGIKDIVIIFYPGTNYGGRNDKLMGEKSSIQKIMKTIAVTKVKTLFYMFT
jgi:hypothetical protein